MSKISICIPRIHTSTTETILFEAFRKLFIGRILRVEIVINKKTNKRRAFIHYKYVYNTQESNKILMALTSGKCMRVVYQFPYYWKCYKSHIQPPVLNLTSDTNAS